MWFFITFVYLQRVMISMYNDNSLHLAIVALEDKDVVRIVDSKKFITPQKQDKFNLIGNDYWFIINSMEVELNLCGKLSDPGVVLCDFQPYKMIFQKQDEAGKSFFKTDNNLCLTKGNFDKATGGYDVFMQKCGSLDSQSFKLLMTNDDDVVDNREGYISPRGIFVPTDEESSEYERIQIEEDPEYEIGAIDGDLYIKNEVEGENPHLINNINGTPRFWRNGRLYGSLGEFIRSNYGNSRPIDIRNLIKARIHNKRIAGMDNAYSMIGRSAENNALFGSYSDENTSHTGHRKINVAAGSAADVNDTSRNFVGLNSLLGNIYDYNTLRDFYTHVNQSKISGNILKGMQERYSHLNSSNINNPQIDLSPETRRNVRSTYHDESHLKSADGKLAHVNKVGNTAGNINNVLGNNIHTNVAQGNFGNDLNLNNNVADAIHHNKYGFSNEDYKNQHNLHSKTSFSNINSESKRKHASHHHSHGSNDDHDSDDHIQNYNNSNSNASLNDTNTHNHSRNSDQNNHGGSRREDSHDGFYSSTGGRHYDQNNHSESHRENSHDRFNSSTGGHHHKDSTHDHSIKNSLIDHSNESSMHSSENTSNVSSHNDSSNIYNNKDSSYYTSGGSSRFTNQSDNETKLNGSINGNISKRRFAHGVGEKIPVVFNYTKMCANQSVLLQNQNNCIDPSNSTQESSNLNEETLNNFKSLSKNPASLASYLSSGGFGSKSKITKSSKSGQGSLTSNLFSSHGNINAGLNSREAMISAEKRNDTISKGIGINASGSVSGGLSSSGLMSGSSNISARESASMSKSGSYSRSVHSGGHGSVAHSKKTTSMSVNSIYR